ncbi:MULTISPECIES: FKBP-type peptidyl-prolyl cis-trans isomerase [unclassified Paraflavitalea]|uniref:FKBP-type peptidyl-prolyl cis-trans isomerase n=1 Tax=unclassified Paraflavitalea TaxID=2798305 RepID=UPI003D355BF7
MRILSIVLVAVSALFLSGCLKSTAGCTYKVNGTVASSSEEQAIVTYLTSNGLTATKHSSNMYYQILADGTGTASPSQCSAILINYSGKLTNGTVFDSQTSQVFTLGTLIEGWKVGIPLIKKGGQIRLFIPPSLGYGSQDIKDNSGNVVIPGNSILIFDITLTDFQ